MKKLIFTIILGLILILSTFEAEELTTNFLLTTIEKQTINISETKKGLNIQEFKGKAVLIAFFGERCPPCIKEIPEFIKLTNNHKNDLAIIAIEAQNHPTDSVKAFKEEHHINYNVVAGIDHDDFISYLIRRAGYTGNFPLPLLISVDKSGEVQGVEAGKLSHDELEFLVEDLNK